MIKRLNFIYFCIEKIIKVDFLRFSMEDETLEYFKAKSKIKKPSFWEKRRFKKMLNSFSEEDLENMRNYLINFGGPLFKENWDKNDSFNKLIISSFPERIKTLKRKELYGLYKSLKELEKSKGKEYFHFILREFILKTSLLYSSDGWFLNKVLRQGQKR